MTHPIIIYDTEYTTWEGALQSGWSLPGQYRELVQIAAIRFDLEAMVELDEFDVLIKPVKNPLLSEYFTGLTGITQADIEQKAMSFPDAYRLFTAFIGDNKTCCYGGDAAVVRQNLGFNGMPDGEDEFDSLDIGPWFKGEGAAFGVTQKTNSGKLAAVMGAPMNAIQEHNALHDARSIAAAYRFMRGKGVKDFFDAKI